MAIDYIQAIASVGFPIIICLILLFDFKKIVKKNTEAIIEMKIAIMSCKK